MNRGLILVGLVLFAIAGAGVFWVNQNSQKSAEPGMQTEEAKVAEEATAGSDIQNAQTGGTYIEYSRAALDSAAGKRVLFFYANWCPICKPADADFKANISKIPSDVTVIRVNYNDTETDAEEKDLAKKYGITYQHTFVQIDSSGKKITNWNGGGITQLLDNIK